ncbi:MAG TPA: hypothetical protein VFW42_01845 [Fluviicoccus sp.]|nr:hypothetical protein [Fluviicoccus sp.]
MNIRFPENTTAPATPAVPATYIVSPVIRLLGLLGCFFIPLSMLPVWLTTPEAAFPREFMLIMLLSWAALPLLILRVTLRARLTFSARGLERSGAWIGNFRLGWDELEAVSLPKTLAKRQPGYALLQTRARKIMLPLALWSPEGIGLLQAFRDSLDTRREPPVLQSLRAWRSDLTLSQAGPVQMLAAQRTEMDLGKRAGYVTAAMAALTIPAIFSPNFIGARNLEHPAFTVLVLALFAAGAVPAWEYIRREKDGPGAVIVAALFGFGLALAGNLGIHLGMKFHGERITVPYVLQSSGEGRQHWAPAEGEWPGIEEFGEAANFTFTTPGDRREMTLIRGPLGIIDLPYTDLKALHKDGRH